MKRLQTFVLLSLQDLWAAIATLCRTPHTRRDLAIALTLMFGLTANSYAMGSISDLGSLTDIFCTIQQYISGPYLFAIGVVLIIVGAIAIATMEGGIIKMLSSIFVGVGIAATAIPIMQNHFHIANSC